MCAGGVFALFSEFIVSVAYRALKGHVTLRTLAGGKKEKLYIMSGSS